MCKVVYIVCTDENASGNCLPFNIIIHIVYDETVHPTDVQLAF